MPVSISTRPLKCLGHTYTQDMLTSRAAYTAAKNYEQLAVSYDRAISHLGAQNRLIFYKTVHFFVQNLVQCLFSGSHLREKHATSSFDVYFASMLQFASNPWGVQKTLVTAAYSCSMIFVLFNLVGSTM